MKKICEYCGVEYSADKRNRKYCSRKCSGEVHSTKIEKQCPTCGAGFVARPEGKYCSRKCRDLAHVTRVPCSCLICGKSFSVKLSEHEMGLRKYCSRKCTGIGRSRFLTGENSPNWKGGVTPGYLADRRGEKYREWRTLVFKRDNWTCQECGTRGKVHVHHVFPFAKFPEHRFDIWNGITLCHSCHGKIHGNKGIMAA